MLTPELYLTSPLMGKDLAHSQIRIFDHVQKMRYSKTNVEENILMCQNCDYMVIEDEVHFLLVTLIIQKQVYP